MAAQPVLLNNTYRIQPDERLPLFDLPGIPAFAAYDLRDPAAAYFALILSPRDPIPSFSSEDAPVHILWPKASGIVLWPDIQHRGLREMPVLIYRRPNVQKVGSVSEPLSDIVLIRNVIQPVVAALQELSQLNLTHRAIRLDNIFQNSDGTILLGDCLTLPPGAHQPVIFETIENALTHPYGKGSGHITDDIYSLGVLAAIFALGKECTALSIPEENMALLKADRGSFRVITSGFRFSARLEEFFRGVLADRPPERWTLSILEKWLNNQGIPATLPNAPAKASRAIAFAGGEYYTRPSLAIAMNIHWQEASQLVMEEDFYHWVRRAFSEQKQSEQYERARVQANYHGAPQATGHRAASRLISLLYPTMPVSYKNWRIYPLGLASLLRYAAEKEDSQQDLKEFILSRLIHSAIDAIAAPSQALTVFRRQLEDMSSFLEREGPGLGLKRIVYELSPDMPCRSPMMGAKYVTSAAQLLPALEEGLSGNDNSVFLMDDYLACFLAVQMKSSAARDIPFLQGDWQRIEARLAILRIWGHVQRAYPAGHLPKVSQILLNMALKLVGEIIRNREMRAQTEEYLRRAAEQSDFSTMARLLDPSSQTCLADQHEYQRAKARYARLEWEVKWLEAGGLTNKNRVAAMAQRFAASLAILSSSAFLAFFFIWMMT